MDDYRSGQTAATLREFCLKADAFLRRGDQDALPDRRAALEFLKKEKVIFARAGDDFKVVYLRSIHLISDLFDKFGEDELAAQALACYVEKDIGPSPSAALRAEQRWVLWAQSVNYHRREGTDGALQITDALLRDIQTEQVSDDFLTRLHYAHGRHLQKAGRLPEAEESFATALVHGEALSTETAKEDGRPRLRYAHLLVSLIVVQLARISIERSDLRRAWRLLSVAGSLQAGIANVAQGPGSRGASADPINKSFVDLQKGTVLRQQQKLDEAISLLEKTVAAFRAEVHYRYLMRTQYELSKAYLNRAELPQSNTDDDLKSARKRLEDLRLTRSSHPERFRGDQRLRDRFEVRCEILAARISQRMGALDEALVSIDAAFRMLDGALSGTSRDLIVLATWVKGDILIELNRAPEAVKLCLSWTRQRDEREPVDRTDDAWVDLVLWKAYVCADDLFSARKYRKNWTATWGSIENVYVQHYASRVTALHDQRLESGFFVDSATAMVEAGYYDWPARKEQLQRFLIRTVMEKFPQEDKNEWAVRLGMGIGNLNLLLRSMGLGNGASGEPAAAPLPATRKARTGKGGKSSKKNKRTAGRS